jgi:hypothetical protein
MVYRNEKRKMAKFDTGFCSIKLLILLGIASLTDLCYFAILS